MAGCGVWANGSEEEARCGGSTLLSGSRGTSVEWMATSRRYFLAYGFRGGHVTRAVAVVVAERARGVKREACRGRTSKLRSHHPPRSSSTRLCVCNRFPQQTSKIWISLATFIINFSLYTTTRCQLRLYTPVHAQCSCCPNKHITPHSTNRHSLCW
jgi:hypothetical protein